MKISQPAAPIAAVDLLEKSAHTPPFLSPSPCTAPTIARKMNPQIKAYSIEVVPRVSWRKAVRIRFTTRAIP